MTLAARPGFCSPLVRVLDVACCAPRSGPGCEEHSDAADIVLVRRGLFLVHRGPKTLLADPGTAVVFAAEESFRVSHPNEGGDRCTALRFAPQLHEEAFGARETHTLRLGPTRAPGDEEQALLLLARVAQAPPLRISRLAERRAAEVRALVAAEPAVRWRLAEIASCVNCSPYHLARQFQAATGTTIGRYLLSVRLTLALDRITEGEQDLARLAADLGFSSHSHLTKRFRERFGCAPSQMRKTVTAAAQAPS